VSESQVLLERVGSWSFGEEPEVMLDPNAPEPGVANSFNYPLAKQYISDKIDDLCRVGVPDTAAFLDEHLPGWHARVTRPLQMESVHDCVLGQVFEAEEGDRGRRFFGLLPPKKSSALVRSGYVKGRLFLDERHYLERPFVFSAPQAAAYWMAEIERRVAKSGEMP
jgi:hypothetical protein